jgi:hypothetical protein
MGFTPVSGSPAEFRRTLAREVDKWGKIIRLLNIKPE